MKRVVGGKVSNWVHDNIVPGSKVNAMAPLGAFTLFEFSPKFDPVASMLVQNHDRVLPDFYGLTTSFRREGLESQLQEVDPGRFQTLARLPGAGGGG